MASLNQQTIMASNRFPSFNPLINQQQQQQHRYTQSYPSAASLFATMEENISKNVLNMIGAQRNDNNMMVATICNVIDTVVSNFVNIFDDRFKIALDQLNKNWMNNVNVINNKINGILLNMEENKKLINREVKEKENDLANSINNNNNILLNNINDIIGKNNKNIIYHTDNLINKMDKKIDKINTKIMSEEEEKESLVEILLNDIDIIKSKINLYEINNNKLDELINEFKKSEKNIKKKDNKMAEIINNKFEKIENIINNKKNKSSKVMVIKLDEMNKEILNIKNKINNNMNKLENINKNMVNMKNECKASTFSNDAALQKMGKKLDNNNNNNNNKIRKINVKYKNKKNNKKNNNKHKNKNKNKKINNKNNNNKEDLVLINDNTIKASLDNNNNNKDDIIWGQKSNPIITRNKTLYGEKNKEENGIEFFIECTTFDNQYGGCTKGNIVGINIKNNDNGEFKVYAIIKWHDELIKKYVIPERGKDATTTHLNWFVLDRKPEDDERDIHFLNLKGKSLDNNICLNKLYMGKNIIL